MKDKRLTWIIVLLIVVVSIYPLQFSFKNNDIKPVNKIKIIPMEMVDLKPSILQEKTKEEKLDQALQEYKKEMKIKAFRLCNSYIGVKGDCYAIAIRFVKELKGLNNTEKYEIKESEAIAGDLIFYRNNGYGNTHWAVYLDEDIALHGAGQFDYRTYLRVVHEPNMSKPKFYRVVERKDSQ